jgi:hypothetical protein
MCGAAVFQKAPEITSALRRSIKASGKRQAQFVASGIAFAAFRHQAKGINMSQNASFIQDGENARNRSSDRPAAADQPDRLQAQGSEHAGEREQGSGGSGADSERPRWGGQEEDWSGGGAHSSPWGGGDRSDFPSQSTPVPPSAPDDFEESYGKDQDAGLAGHEEFDPEYYQWRAGHMRAIDEEYRLWRKENSGEQRFSDEFNQWRAKRAQSANVVPEDGEA